MIMIMIMIMIITCHDITCHDITCHDITCHDITCHDKKNMLLYCHSEMDILHYYFIMLEQEQELC